MFIQNVYKKVLILIFFVLINASISAYGSIKQNNTKEYEKTNYFECVKRKNQCESDKLFEGQGIFVSISTETLFSSENIIKKFVDLNLKLKVNVVIFDDYKDSKFTNKTKKIVTLLKQSKLDYNLIYIKEGVAAPVFIRDLAYFDYRNSLVDANVLPYTQNSIYGPKVVEKLSYACGFNISYSYRQRITNAVEIQKRWDDSKRSSLMGGNISLGPRGILFVGNSKHSPFDIEILNFLKSKYEVLKVELPDLNIGHIDEVYNFINDENSRCHFSILKASPLEAINFLKTRPSNELISATQNPDFLISSDKIESQDIQFHRNLADLSEKMSKKKENQKLISSIEFNNLESSLKKKMKLDKNRNISTKDILNNQSLINYWNELEVKINTSLNSIVKFINKLYGRNCNPKVISLPVFFSPEGAAWIPNPVNGEEIEGHYLFSKQNRFLYEDKLNWDNEIKQFSFGPTVQSFYALDKYVSAILLENTKLKPESIDTREYDFGMGNFHCATNTIKKICKK